LGEHSSEKYNANAVKLQNCQEYVTVTTSVLYQSLQFSLQAQKIAEVTHFMKATCGSGSTYYGEVSFQSASPSEDEVCNTKMC
jgi:hypothetical protein